MTEKAKKLGDRFIHPATDEITLHAIEESCKDDVIPIQFGLTKREYFAAMALSGLLKDPRVTITESSVKFAVQAADLLLEELTK
jgi:hypothetical protein